jgi:thymidylate synthase ThyX
MDRKRIFEAAAGELPMQATTSFVWTSNPVALSKMFLERRDASADLEFNRLATKWQALCLAISPNLFPYQE